MPLEKNLIPFPFRGGVDTKTDSKQLPPPKLVTLENGVFTTPGRIDKRAGYSEVGGTIWNDEAASGCLMAYGDELLAGDGLDLYTYTAGTSGWTSRGKLPSVKVTMDPVLRGADSQALADCAIHSGGLTCYVWLEGSGDAIRYALVDTASGAVVVSSTVLNGTLAASHSVTSPKVLASGAWFVVLWMDYDTSGGGTSTWQYQLRMRCINATTRTLDTEAMVGTMRTGTSHAYDACTTGSSSPTTDRVYLGYTAPDSGGAIGQLGMRYLTTQSGGVVLSAETLVTNGIPAAVSVFVDYPDGFGSQRVMFAYAVSATSTVYYSQRSSTLTLLGGGTVVSGSASSRVCGVSRDLGNGNGERYFVVQLSAGIVLFEKMDSGFSVVNVGYTYKAKIGSKPFIYRGRMYCALLHDSTLQTTYFLAAQSTYAVVSTLCAKWLSGEAVVSDLATTGELLPEINAVSDTSWQMVAYVYGQVSGLNSVILEMDPVPAAASAEIGNTLHFGGGFLRSYDGQVVTEAGFHLYPEDITAGQAGSGGGKNYQYVAVYEWTDNQGNVWQSAPSPVVSITNGNTISIADPATVTVPSLTFTNKSGAVAAIYRTIHNGTVFYRVGTVDNAYQLAALSFPDEVEDADLEENTQLYTQPGTAGTALENQSPGPGMSLVSYRSRLFLLDSSNPLRLWYSKANVPGYPVEFAGLLTRNIPAAGGDATALAVLDEKLIIFKADRLFFMVGEGPADNGTSDDFSPITPILSDVGCTNHRSVVATPAGLMFASAKGIYLLDRSLSLSYIGAEVESYNSDTITSAHLMPDTNQVRFTLLSGVVLVFDYLMKQWSVFTGIAGADSALWSGRFCWLYLGDNETGGYVAEETPGTYVDSLGGTTNYIALKLTTGWLNVGAIQGCQRIYKIFAIGDYHSAHKLTLSVAYDYDSTITENVFGVSGSSPYLWRFQPRRQKCEAIQVTLQDSYTSVNGRGLSLSAITLEAGIKRGTGKRPTSQGLT